MSERFSALLRQHTDAIVRAWVNAIYADRRTDLRLMLSFSQLVDHLPDLLEELARVLDRQVSYGELLEAVRHLRFHPQVRFQQGCLIDEVARELMILRNVLNDFLWREGIVATDGDVRELGDVLRRADTFVDELLAQVILTYAASLRPNVPTRTSSWPPPRRRKSDFPEHEEL